MDRLLVAEGESWRAPHEDELDSLTLNKPPEDAAACFCLFSVPAHMRTRFWAMLNEEASAGTGDFDEFSDVRPIPDFQRAAAPEELGVRTPCSGRTRKGEDW